MIGYITCPLVHCRYEFYVMFCLLYKHTNVDYFLRIFKDLRTLSEISEEAPMMFRSHGNTSKFTFKQLCNHRNGDLFTCGNNMLFSQCEDIMFKRKSSPDISLVFI